MAGGEEAPHNVRQLRDHSRAELVARGGSVPRWTVAPWRRPPDSDKTVYMHGMSERVRGSKRR
jgi:hypothetical protein